MVQQAHLASTLKLYADIEAIIVRTATLAKRLDLTVLILSILTSSNLWLLVTNALPKSTLWFGAFASTLVTGITLYMSGTGLKRTRTRALALHGEVAKLLAKVRSDEISEGEFWNEYKALEQKFWQIQHGRPDE
jgi:hypothetical protein